MNKNYEKTLIEMFSQYILKILIKGHKKFSLIKGLI